MRKKKRGAPVSAPRPSTEITPKCERAKCLLPSCFFLFLFFYLFLFWFLFPLIFDLGDESEDGNSLRVFCLWPDCCACFCVLYLAGLDRQKKKNNRCRTEWQTNDVLQQTTKRGSRRRASSDRVAECFIASASRFLCRLKAAILSRNPLDTSKNITGVVSCKTEGSPLDGRSHQHNEVPLLWEHVSG